MHAHWLCFLSFNRERWENRMWFSLLHSQMFVVNEFASTLPGNSVVSTVLSLQLNWWNPKTILNTHTAWVSSWVVYVLVMLIAAAVSKQLCVTSVYLILLGAYMLKEWELFDTRKVMLCDCIKMGMKSAQKANIDVVFTCATHCCCPNFICMLFLERHSALKVWIWSLWWKNQQHKNGLNEISPRRIIRMTRAGHRWKAIEIRGCCF